MLYLLFLIVVLRKYACTYFPQWINKMEAVALAENIQLRCGRQREERVIHRREGEGGRGGGGGGGGGQ